MSPYGAAGKAGAAGGARPENPRRTAGRHHRNRARQEEHRGRAAAAVDRRALCYKRAEIAGSPVMPTTPPTERPDGQRRSQAAGNPGLPADQNDAGIRRRQAGTDLAQGQARLSDPRRHPDHAAGRGAAARLNAESKTRESGNNSMIKIWGRNTSSNVQKAMWAVGELGLEHDAHRRRRRVRQEQGAGLSGDEPERPGADAGGRRRLHAVGIQFDRALSRRQARQERRAGAEGRQAARARQPMDGLAIVGGRPGDHAGVLGPDPHAAGKARHWRRSRPRRTRPPTR